MIDTANETRCKNPSCSKPVHQVPGHRRREYCNPTCKQTAYRLRKDQPHHDVTIVDDRQVIGRESAGNSAQDSLLDRATLERRFLDIGSQLKYPQLKGIVTLSEIVNLSSGISSWHAFLEQADDTLLVEAIHHAEVYLDIMITFDRGQDQRRIAQLEQELAEKDELIEQLLDKKQSKQPFKRQLQERLTRILEQQDWPALDIHYRVKAGQKEGRVFIIGASIDLLSRALGQLEEGDHSQS